MGQKSLFREHDGTSFRQAVVKLVGHIVGGAILFLVVALMAWLLGFAVDSLHRLHPFPEKVLVVVHTAELWLLYADILLTAIVIVFGVATFIKELGGSHHG